MRLSSRSLTRSLQGRMLALSLGATLVVLALAGWAMSGVLGRFVTEGLDRRLDAELALLASAVDRDGRIDEARLRQTLGALDEGPGWQWRIRAPGRTLGNADFAPVIADGPPPLHPPLPCPPLPDDHARRPLELAGRDGLRLHARTLTLASPGGPVELIATAPRAVLRRPLEAAMTPLLTMLALLAAIMGLAAVAQLRLGLRPLRRLADELAAIRAGQAVRVSEDQPLELRPLAEELNALAAHNETALATARLAAANLAHALKTPVATLALDLRDDAPRAAQVAQIEATIRHHLARARSQTGGRPAATPLAPAIAAVADAVRRLHGDAAPAMLLDVAQAPPVAVDGQDLDELLGNLLDNAARHARSRVAVAAAADADARWARIEIADDGPGIPAADRPAVARPGIRLDERAPGHGFGLSIATELVALYGGRLDLDDAAGGGLLVRFTLPAVAAKRGGQT